MTITGRSALAAWASSQSSCSGSTLPVVWNGIVVSIRATVTPGSSIHWSPLYFSCPW